MAILACFYKNGKGVTGNRVAADSSTAVIAGTRQMTVDTMNISLVMKEVRIILYLTLMASSAEGIGGSRCARLLGMDFMAVNASYPNHTMPAGLPFNQGAGVTATTQLCRVGNLHTFFGMLGPVGAMTSFTGYTSQDKLTGGSIISGSMAGEALARLFYLL